MLWTVCSDLANTLYFVCQANNVRNVYLAGSMTGQSQLVREYLEKAFTILQNTSGQVSGFIRIRARDLLE